MTHQEIENSEIVERYVRGALSPEERRAFQEHFFTCDRCFEQVQTTERFAAGIRHAAEAGLLEANRAARASDSARRALWPGWMTPAFAAMGLILLAVSVALAWLLLYRLPELSEQVARERQMREQSEGAARQSLDEALETLEAERQQRARLEDQVHQHPPAKRETQLAQAAEAQPNIPLVMLEATRDTQSAGNEVSLPARASSIVLWIEAEPSARFERFRLQVFAADNRLLHTVAGLKRNKYGALAVSLPAGSLPAGKYRVRLYGGAPAGSELVGEYNLRIQKQ